MAGPNGCVDAVDPRSADLIRIVSMYIQQI